MYLLLPLYAFVRYSLRVFLSQSRDTLWGTFHFLPTISTWHQYLVWFKGVVHGYWTVKINLKILFQIPAVYGLGKSLTSLWPFSLMCEIFKPYSPQEFVGRTKWDKACKVHSTVLSKLQTVDHFNNSSYFIFISPSMSRFLVVDYRNMRVVSYILEITSCYCVNHLSE